MPRPPRLNVPGFAQHVVQRGNDRSPCFFRDSDYLVYLHTLRDAATAYECQVHAYVLMTNHVHLLVTPAHPTGLSRMMQGVGRAYVRYVNDARSRTGTLWEGRYKACLVDNERYVLACYRYIELNPVRAGIVRQPLDYPWSSHGCNALGKPDALIVPHPAYIDMARDDSMRLAAYRALVAQGVDDAELATIRLYSRRQQALGSDAFVDNIERCVSRSARIKRPGRPRKPAGEIGI